MDAELATRPREWESPLRRLSLAAALAILRALFRISTRCRVIGRDRVPPDGPLILASNHISHFDPPLITLAIPRKVDWMAMAELHSRPWSDALFRSWNCIPVRRGAPDVAAIREALARLAAGRMVGVFPEGGIRDGEASLLAAGRPLRGASLLARKSGAPVLPAAILGSDRLYNWRRWKPWSRAPVWIGFGHPFPAASDDDSFAAALKSALHALRDEFLAHGATADDLPRPPRVRMAEP